MKQPIPEFSRPLAVDRVPRGGSYEKIAAEPAECAALARRLGVPAVHGVAALLHATPWRGGGLKLDGRLTADLDQVSVVSLDSFRSTVEFPVLRYFLAGGSAPDSEEMEYDAIDGGIVDLGEVVAETLALELDPYPRRAGESFAEVREAEPEAQEKASPFAALSRLKPK